MIIMRPVTIHDVDRLVSLIDKASVGITTLPRNKQAILKRVELSIESFQKKVTQPAGELYFFVLEDLVGQTIGGCSAIKACVGNYNTPFYSYKVSKVINFSKELNCQFKTGLLSLVNDYQGVAELTSLYLNRDMRKLGLGKILSFSRLLFIADRLPCFPEMIIAELRGVSDKKGISPFWKCVGQHFFKIDFAKADYLNGIGYKQFIADLMPRYPIYTCLLPQMAQDIIGVAHEASQPAKKLLEAQGFYYANYVDIFDAGPTIQAYMNQIKLIQQSVAGKISKIIKNIDTDVQYIIATVDQGFKACMGTVAVIDDVTVNISENVAQALQLSVGEKIRYYRI